MTDHSDSPDHRPGFWEPNTEAARRRAIPSDRLPHEANEAGHVDYSWSALLGFVALLAVLLLIGYACNGVHVYIG